jgi:hypothetical protein
MESGMSKNLTGESADHEKPRDGQRAAPDIVELASMDSFPASDPPPWTLGRAEHTPSARRRRSIGKRNRGS